MRNFPLTVLCIDDDDDDTELFREAINTVDETCVCVTVTGAKEGLHLLLGAPPDMIFLDINMPIMDGREALANIRSTKILAHVPVFMFSTTIDQKECDRLKKIGATACFTKPRSFKAMCMILDGVLKKFKAA